jgi:hypothetical protein
VALLQRDLRASDVDREQTVAFLKAHYAEGRLTAGELAWRSDAAYRAVGIAELERLAADLPRAPRPPRKRHPPVVPLVLLVAALTAWLVIVPPEVSLALVLICLVLGVLAVVLLSPVWIPVLLAFIAYRLIRARVSVR